MYCAGHDQVLGMATHGRGCSREKNLHEGQHPAAVDHQLRNEDVKEDAVFCWIVLTQPGCSTIVTMQL